LAPGRLFKIRGCQKVWCWHNCKWDTDKPKPQFTRYRACFACPSFEYWTDLHGFSVIRENPLHPCSVSMSSPAYGSQWPPNEFGGHRPDAHLSPQLVYWDSKFHSRRGCAILVGGLYPGNVKLLLITLPAPSSNFKLLQVK